MQRMATNSADFSLTFRRLCDAVAGPQGDEEVRKQFADAGAYDLWASEWRRRLEEEPVSSEARATAMRLASPAYIPRNHVVEAALDAAVERQDFQPFEDLLEILSHPYEEKPDLERYVTPASPEECVRQTFCGT
jgi:serine/tyrosine/threonine adenylyltransferase